MAKEIRISNPILASIASWAQDNVEGIEFAYGTAGGWEGWAQVELARRLKRDHGASFGLNQGAAIHREVPIYTSSERSKADIAIYRNNDLGSGAFIFELKCESVGNSASFKAEVIKDLVKVQKGLKPAFKKANIWVIGLALSNNANTAMEKANKELEAQGAQQFDEYDFPGGSGPVTVWWVKKSVAPGLRGNL